MERQTFPEGGLRYSTARGSMDVWMGPPILALRLSGVGEADFVPPIIDAFDTLRKGDRSVQLFVDTRDLVSYDSALRTDLTKHFLQHRAQIAELHVFTQSKLVAMGVSVANLALNGIVTSHSRREAFIATFAATLQKTGVKSIRSTIFGA